MRALTWANAEGAKFGGSTFTLLTKDENLSIAIKDVTKQKDPEKANAELEKILKETKKEKSMETLNEFAKKIAEIANDVDKKKKKISDKNFVKKKVMDANSALNQVDITKEKYSKTHETVVRNQLENAKKNIARILKDIDKFNK